MAITVPTVAEPLPPHSIEAEEGLLGATLVRGAEVLVEVGALDPADFFRPSHATLWRTLCSLEERGAAIDFVTVCAALEHSDVFVEIGGTAFLAHLIGSRAYNSFHAATYAEIIRRTALQRRLISAAGRIAAIGYSCPDDLDAAFAEIERVWQWATGRSLSERRRRGLGGVPVA